MVLLGDTLTDESKRSQIGTSLGRAKKPALQLEEFGHQTRQQSFYRWIATGCPPKEQRELDEQWDLDDQRHFGESQGQRVKPL